MPGAVARARAKHAPRLNMPPMASGSSTGAGGAAGAKNNPTGNIATSVRGLNPMYFPQDQPGRQIDDRKPLVLDQPAPYLTEVDRSGGTGAPTSTIGNTLPVPDIKPINRLKEQEDDGEGGVVVQAKTAGDVPTPEAPITISGAKRIKEDDVITGQGSGGKGGILRTVAGGPQVGAIVAKAKPQAQRIKEQEGEDLGYTSVPSAPPAVPSTTDPKVPRRKGWP